MNVSATSEEQALLAVLTALEATEGSDGQLAALPAILAGGAATAEQAGDATTETLTRLFQELLGLVPFALPPLSPSPKVKRRLLAAIAQTEVAALPVQVAPAAPDVAAAAAPGGPAGSATAAAPAASEGSATAAIPAAPKTAATLAALDTLAAPTTPKTGATLSTAPMTPATLETPEIGAAPGAAQAPIPFPAAAARSPRRWNPPLAMAAGLILALLGACAWLYHGLLTQGETIARLNAERTQALQHLDQMESRMSRLTTEVSDMRSNFSVVTSPAVEVCSMRPVAQGMGDVHGILFVAADHQHWYMSLRGLPPAGAGRVYQLWFIGDQGPVSAGTFGAPAGAAWDVGAEHMPAGTREVRVTLEAGAGATTPAGPEVLRNSDPFRTL
jgi:uncharacterized coiled-coil protein SlyX